MRNIKIIAATELILNQTLLKTMYLLVLNSYYEIEEQKFSIDNYTQNIQNNDMKKVIFYLEKDGEILSYLECELLRENRYYMSRLTTDKNYRNKGYARKLLNELVEHLKMNDATEVVINVNKNKPWLRNFYEDFGFTLFSENPELDEATYKLYIK